MEIYITNKDQLNKWLNERREFGRDVYSIKGKSLEGATYEDGELISLINIAWKDVVTGEVFTIEYDYKQSGGTD